MSAFREPAPATDKREVRQPAAKITAQYRAKLGMIYEIESSGRAFSIRILRTGELDAGPWQIEVLAGVGDGQAAVVEQGDTRGEALSAVAKSWENVCRASGLPELDWDEIAQALGSVRAI